MDQRCENCQYCAGSGVERRVRCLKWWEKLLCRSEPKPTKHRVIECARYPAWKQFIFKNEKHEHWCGDYQATES